MNHHAKIAKILRVEQSHIEKLAENMNNIFSKSGCLERVVAENDFRVKEILGVLGLSDKSSRKEIYKKLIEKLKKDDQKLFKILDKPRCTSQEDCNQTFDLAKKLTGAPAGYFVKEEKMTDMLRQAPPVNMMKALGYSSVDELLRKEDNHQVFSALRFTETREWMNNQFVPLYKDITWSDFIQREIKIILLDEKWLKIAEKFLQKKYHNVSHLKELGIVFVIPLRIDSAGETLRVFSLLLHYLHEVSFYNKLFLRHKEDRDFGERIISLLRGDVSGEPLDETMGKNWRIVQRYLAKDDKDDQRLFEPHVNPETIHWDKAENDLTQLDVMYSDMEFSFWKDLNFVGDFFANGGEDELVSFNLIDTVMSLVKEEEMIKYLYHHQEALWNRIFVEYFGKETLEKLIIENFAKGYIAMSPKV